jgi:hypothetical protein
MEIMNNMRSSYIKNDFGSVFRALILSHKPKLAVECGVLDGYSTFHIAHAIRFNRITRGIKCPFFAYDLWEEYDYKHGDFVEVENMLEEQGLSDYCNLTEGNAYKVYEIFEDNSIDFLHVDISNNGETFLDMLSLWGRKISNDGIVVFEGGSEERDEVEWMKKYMFTPIRNVLDDPILYENWYYQVLHPFPSMTLLWKK